jgi:hypothetical protein
MLVSDLRMGPAENISFHLNMFHDHNLGCFNHLTRAVEPFLLLKKLKLHSFFINSIVVSLTSGLTIARW